jgi:hypothetical protein
LRDCGDQLGGFDEHDLGEARQGLEFSVERHALDAIDAVDASAPDNAEDEFRAPGASEGLSDHHETSVWATGSGLPPRANLLFFFANHTATLAECPKGSASVHDRFKAVFGQLLP